MNELILQQETGALSREHWHSVYADALALDRRSIAYNDIDLIGHFQPIFSLPHRRVVGYEGLIRGVGASGTTVPPLQLFADCRDQQARIHLDRLCRTLHVARFAASDVDNAWLFLNVTPAVMQVDRSAMGFFFANLLDHFQVPPERVVVEILEDAVSDERLLVEVVRYYQQMGCLIAIDDFGVDASDMRRVWRISPHIVKLDRHVIEAAVEKPAARRALHGMVGMLHEMGSLVLVEGVETAEQMQLIVLADVDLAQGYYLAKPQSELLVSEPLIATAELNIDLAYLPSEMRALAMRRIWQIVRRFDLAAKRFERGETLAMACEKLLLDELVERTYLIDVDGHQRGASLTRQNSATSRLFAPLQHAEDANWSRKPYFVSALLSPGSVQISRPYLSVANAHRCVTLSMAAQINSEMFVLCCDIDFTAAGWMY